MRKPDAVIRHKNAKDYPTDSLITQHKLRERYYASGKQEEYYVGKDAIFVRRKDNPDPFKGFRKLLVFSRGKSRFAA